MNAILDRGLQAIEEAQVIVTKIGGENALEFQMNYEQIMAQEKKQFVAISALRTDTFNTTTKLIAMARLAEQGDPAAFEEFEVIRQFHLSVIREKVEPQYHEEMIRCMEAEFKRFRTVLEEVVEGKKTVHELGKDFLYTDDNGIHHSFTGFGEEVVEKLYHTYFTLKGTAANSLHDDKWKETVLGPSAPEAMRLQKSVIQRLRRNVKSQVAAALQSENKVTITGGYKRGVAFRRSYTDLTAAEIARASSSMGWKTVLAVEKKDPILSADPRKVDKSKLETAHRLGWSTGSELFGIKGAQAGAIHEDVMDVLAGKDVDIVVYDPRNPSRGSTWISEHPDAYQDNPTIIATRNIDALVVVKGSMSNATGVLAKIATSFKHYVLDQTYSSQNMWAITINETDDQFHETVARLERSLQRDYGNSFHVEVHNDRALVLVIGSSERNGYKDALHNAAVQTPFTNSVDEAVSRGYVISKADVIPAVNALHDHAYPRPSLPN